MSTIADPVYIYKIHRESGRICIRASGPLRLSAAEESAGTHLLISSMDRADPATMRWDAGRRCFREKTAVERRRAQRRG